MPPSVAIVDDENVPGWVADAELAERVRVPWPRTG